MIKVLVTGAGGKMGQATVKAVNAHAGLELVGIAGRSDSLQEKIKDFRPDVVVDFTSAESVMINTAIIIEAGVRPVVGSSGLIPEQVQELQAKAAAKKLGGIIAPNFCVGAILMMRFAEQAAKFFPHAEIVELHHDKKQDAPSGTSVKTAEMLDNVRQNIRADNKEILLGARGATLNDVPIHSIRLPGLLAHQEVLFGGEGELLTIRHDSFNREAYMPGVCMACEQVMGLNELVYGLEEIL